MFSLSKVYILLLLFSLAFGASLKENVVRYDDFKVYKIRIQSPQQYEEIRRLESKYNLNFWNEVRRLEDDFDIMVPPLMQEKFENYMLAKNYSYGTKIKNVQSLIDAGIPSQRSSRMDWKQYNTLDEINIWLDEIVDRYPDVITPFSIGNSHEGRKIKGIKISYKTGNKAIFIESTIHAREWITSAAITYVIDELLVSRNPAVRDIAENLDWYIIPVLNVDGFVYSHEVNRMWRKSRLLSDPAGTCYGTDLNRNFDFLWMSVGASDNPCSETYAGPYAESDVEIKQMLQYINTSIPEDTIRIYISLHSYGQYVLSPWGHTEDFPEHYPEMMHVAKGYADALYRRFNTVFTYDKVSGSGKEWAYGVKGIPIPYTIELRDKSEYGFLLPPEYIIPVGSEVLDGFVGMVDAAREVNVI